jgi:nucleotide-binding universal stress UspA family protein
MVYEGPLRIPRNQHLSAAEAEVEARFATQIRERLNESTTEYLARFGPVIDTDRARELCADYSATKATRTRFSRAVYNPAKALAEEIYRREIRRAAPRGGWRILFTSGGIGVGKSTALAWLSEEPKADEHYDILVDGTLSDHQAAQEKIREALALGHRVTVIHVHREFSETVKLVVKRAIEIGRAVTLDNIAATHFRSRETLFDLVEEFGARLTVRVLENRGEEPSRVISLPELASEQARSVDQLREMAHALFVNEFASLKVDYPDIHEAFFQKGSRR